MVNTQASAPIAAVRKMDTRHLARAAELFDAYRVFYGQESDRPRAQAFLRERMERADAALFVAEIDGEVQGFMQMYPSLSSVSLGPIWILNDLYVDESARGQSVGTALLAHAVSHARETGASRLTLSTARDNRAAKELYAKMGWQPDDYFQHFYRATE